MSEERDCRRPLRPARKHLRERVLCVRLRHSSGHADVKPVLGVVEVRVRADSDVAGAVVRVRAALAVVAVAQRLRGEMPAEGAAAEGLDRGVSAISLMRGSVLRSFAWAGVIVAANCRTVEGARSNSAGLSMIASRSMAAVPI